MTPEPAVPAAAGAPAGESAAFAPPPWALLAELTHRCPLHCPYCSNPLTLAARGDELDTATWKRVLAEAAALGVVQVHFSGGEPLARGDLAELVAAGDALGLYPYVVTGGTLATEARLAELHRSGLRALQISLQGASPDQNDRIAGRVSFERKRAAVAAARALGLHVTLNVVLHRENLDDVEAIVAIARAWRVDRLELAHTQYVGWAFRNRAALMPRREQVARALAAVERARREPGTPPIGHVLPDYFQDRPKACLGGWGRVYLSIAPDGVVLPCQAAREMPGLELPRVQEQTLRAIWFESSAFRRFRGIEWMPEPCRSCPRRDVDFGGCRCQAWLLAGDPALTDPVCALSPQRARVDAALAADEATSFVPREA